MSITANSSTVNAINLIHNGYTFVDFIESTGNQYIDTGFTPGSGPIKIECAFRLIGTSGDQTLFGTTTDGVISLNAMVGSNTWQFGTGRTWVNITDSTCNNDKHYIECYYSNGSQTLTIDNELKASATYGFSGDSSTLRIFNHYNRYYASARLYFFKIYNNNVLVRDLIPAKTSSSIGLYDLVNNVFYGYSGSGTMYYGGKCGEDYQEVEYIQSSGTQYIDTGVKLNPNSEIFMRASWVADSGNYDTILGSRGGADYFVRLYNNFSSKTVNWSGAQITCGSVQSAGYVYDISITGTSSNKIIKFNSETYSSSTGTTNATVNAWIFGINNNGSLYRPSSSRVYSCKIYNNGTLVRDFVPCIRKSDSAGGLYDIINKQFYGNSGSGSFSYGSFTYSGRINLLTPSTSYAQVKRTAIPTYSSTQLNSWFPLSSDSWGNISNTSDLSSHVGENCMFKVYVSDTNRYAYLVLKLNSISGTTIYTSNIKWAYANTPTFEECMGYLTIL